MNTSRSFLGDRSSKRVRTQGDLRGLDVGGTSLAGPTYVVSAAHAVQHASDRASQLYDITTKLGRGKEQKEQRKRKKENQDYLPFKKTDTLTKTRKQSPSAAANISTATELGDDIDEKFLANLDQNNLAAKALSIAQATLRGESPRQNSHNATLATSTKTGKDDAAARVCISLLIFSYSLDTQRALRHYLELIYGGQNPPPMDQRKEGLRLGTRNW